MTVKLSFDIDPEIEELVQNIIDYTDAKTYKEVFERAIGLYEWLLRQNDDGNDVVLIDSVSGKHLEVVLPGMEEEEQVATVEEDKSKLN